MPVLTQEEMRRRIAGARVATLATTTPAGAPHAVPFCFVLEGDDLLSAVDAKPKRTRRLARLDNVRSDPRVAVLVDEWDEDWSRLWWVRVDGRARIVEDAAEERSAIDRLAGKYEQYRAHPPTGPVIAIRAERWSGWSAS